MKFGRDFFKILSLVIQIMRLIAATLGDEEDKKEAAESRDRTKSADPDEPC